MMQVLVLSAVLGATYDDTDTIDDARAKTEAVFIVVVDDAPIRDAATDKPLGTLLRGSCVRQRKGETVYRYWEWSQPIKIDPKLLLPKEEARKFFDERIRTKPKAADYADRASIRANDEAYADAIDDLDRALKLKPDFYRALVRRSECLLYQFYHSKDDAGRKFLELSLKDAERCVELKPDDFRSYDALYRPLLSYDTVRGVAEAEKAASMRPDHAVTLNNWSKGLVDLGRHDEALKKLDRALEIDPEYSDAYTNRGIIFHNRRQFDKAIADATKAIEFNSLNTSAWNNRGNAYMETREWEKAIDDFSEVVKIAADSSDGYFGRANVLFSRGNAMDEEDYVRKGLPTPTGKRRSTESYRLALADCDDALKQSPRDYKCYNTKGNTLKKLDEPRKAIEVFDLAIDKIREESAARGYTAADDQGKQHVIWEAVEEAMAFAETGRYDEFKHRVAMAHPQRAAIAAILGNRADAWRMLMQDFKKPDASAAQKMLNDLTRAILFDPNNADYYRVRGYYNLQFKRWEAAISDLSRANQLRPNYADAIRGRSIAYRELKKFDEAWEDVRALEKLGTPVDGATLKLLKEASGRDK